MKKSWPSRLQRKEETRNIRKALFYSALTLLLVLSIVFLGLPALIKLAIFIGNVKSSYTQVETKDLIPPAPPKLSPLPEATNSAQIDIQGFSEPGSNVEIFLSGNQLEKIITDSDGSFLFRNVILNNGDNEIFAVAIDSSGNSSQQSGKLVISFDNTPPELTITQPNENAYFSLTQQRIEVKGNTEDEAMVTINGRLVVVDLDGKFSFPMNLQEGENKIKIVSIDKAGNQTEKEIIVKRE